MVSAVRITPMLLPAFNTPLANELSFLGNHSEVVFMAYGKLVDSPSPSNARTIFKLKNDRTKPVSNPAILQIIIPIAFLCNNK